LHEADVFTFVESLGRDIRFAGRMLAKHPTFTALAILALAIGIGVNTAVFTVYKALLLQPLDARDPGQPVNIYRTTAADRYQPAFSYPDFAFYRDENKVFSGLVATTGDELALTGPEHLSTAGNTLGSALEPRSWVQFPDPDARRSGVCQFSQRLRELLFGIRRERHSWSCLLTTGRGGSRCSSVRTNQRELLAEALWRRYWIAWQTD
jgi:hypothetical protein